MQKGFMNLGITLSRDEAKLVIGGDYVSHLEVDAQTCNSTCTSSSDCPSDRSCKSGTCPDGTTIYACFRA